MLAAINSILLHDNNKQHKCIWFILLCLISLRTATGARLGCFLDDSDRHMSVKSTLNDSAITPQLCIEYCYLSDYLYAGVENSTECYCNNTYGHEGYNQVNDSECDYKCTGDQSKTCGGAWRIEIFDAQPMSLCETVHRSMMNSGVIASPGYPGSMQSKEYNCQCNITTSNEPAAMNVTINITGSKTETCNKEIIELLTFSSGENETILYSTSICNDTLMLMNLPLQNHNLVTLTFRYNLREDGGKFYVKFEANDSLSNVLHLPLRVSCENLVAPVRLATTPPIHDKDKDRDSSNRSAMAGGIVGGLVIVTAITVSVIFLIRRRQSLILKQSAGSRDVEKPLTGQGHPKKNKQESKKYVTMKTKERYNNTGNQNNDSSCRESKKYLTMKAEAVSKNSENENKSKSTEATSDSKMNSSTEVTYENVPMTKAKLNLKQKPEIKPKPKLRSNVKNDKLQSDMEHKSWWQKQASRTSDIGVVYDDIEPLNEEEHYIIPGQERYQNLNVSVATQDQGELYTQLGETDNEVYENV